MKPKTSKIIKILTITSSGLATFAAGLSTLPINSEALPLPPSWRPYTLGVALCAAGLRVLVVPVIDVITQHLKDP